MESNNKPYDFDHSLERIDSFINQGNATYKEVNYIPDHDKLSYDNGFYVNCSAIFVDIRESSNLTNNHYRPTLAKLYRAFISEVTGILNSNVNCKEINIIGDCVAGICETSGSSSANQLIDTTSKICSIVDILNCKFKEANINEISIGIGISYGRSLMIKAGNKGSSLDDVVWMGDVVNEASSLCNKANKEGFQETERVIISRKFFDRLSEEYQKIFYDSFLFKPNYDEFEADLIDENMQEWYQETCKSSLFDFLRF